MKSSNRQTPFSQALDFNWSDEIKDVTADLSDLVTRATFSGPGEFAGKAVPGLDTALTAITQRVRQQPLRAVGLALGAGALLGALALRR